MALRSAGQGRWALDRGALILGVAPAGLDARGRLMITVGGRAEGFLEGLPGRSWIAAFDLDTGEVERIYP